MEEHPGSVLLKTENFSLELYAKVFKGDPAINNVSLNVRVESDGFAGAMEMEVGSGSSGLGEFIRQILYMNKTLRGKAEISEPYGHHCFIRFEMDKTGQVIVSGKIVPMLGRR